MKTSALLALEDGTVYHCESIGTMGLSVGEVVFNTAMTGYQEILTDPSYCRQIVTLTYPHIGNVGVNVEDEESTNIHASGLIIRDLSPVVSNWRSANENEESLDSYLERHHVVGLAGIDTRALTRRLRDKGAMKGCIVAGDNTDIDAAIAAARAIENQVYIVAPNQWGEHYDGRVSYGSSVIIDPWGSVICCASERAELVSACVDLDYLDEVRANMPLLKHGRPELRARSL